MTAEKAALLPKMTGSDGTAAGAPVNLPQEVVAPVAPVVQVAPPAPRPPAPAQKEYWIDDTGHVWRQGNDPSVILTIQSGLLQGELDAILETLNSLYPQVL